MENNLLIKHVCNYCKKELKGDYKTVTHLAAFPTFYCTKTKKGKIGSCWAQHRSVKKLRGFLDKEFKTYPTKKEDRIKDKLIKKINALSVRDFNREWLEEYAAVLYKITKAIEALKK